MNAFGGDVFHQNTAPSLSAADFFNSAALLLGRETPRVLHEVIPHLEEYAGRWHPAGFMVFALGDTGDGSSLRLHIWPRGLRRPHSAGKTVHDHPWHIASKTLTEAPNRDVLYTIEPRGILSSAERVARGLHRIFRATYAPGQPDRLTTDGACAKVVPFATRIMNSTTLNRIPAGVYHLDDISEDTTVATLCLDSPTVIEGPHILINTTASEIEVNRPAVTLEEALRAKALVLGSLALAA